METCNSRRKVLILDCCYSGAYPAGRMAKARLTTLGAWDRLAPKVARAETRRSRSKWSRVARYLMRLYSQATP